MLRFKVHKKLDMEGGMKELRAEGELPSGGMGVISGLSGAGKSSLLKALAGLLSCEEERVRFGEERWADTERGKRLSARRRSCTMLLQEPALFPNMSVEKNIRSALPKGRNEVDLNEWIERVGLGELRSVRPSRLSGGQQQRVGVLRALAAHPRLLLLDEPFAGLDKGNMERMLKLIEELRLQEGMSVLIATHAPLGIGEEADRAWYLEDGKLEQLEEGTKTSSFQVPGTQVMNEGITGVVLAGGKSRRMGCDKGLMEWNGKPMAQYSLDALSAVTEGSLIVANYSEYRRFRVPQVADLWPDHGPLGGILTALLATDADRILVLPCDMPYMDPGLLEELLKKSGPAITVAAHDRKKEPLVGIYPRSFIELGEAMLEEGVRSVHEALEALGKEWVRTVELGGFVKELGKDPFKNLNQPPLEKTTSYEP